MYKFYDSRRTVWVNADTYEAAWLIAAAIWGRGHTICTSASIPLSEKFIIPAGQSFYTVYE